jgi:SAM-dependent methyltransferase
MSNHLITTAELIAIKGLLAWQSQASAEKSVCRSISSMAIYVQTARMLMAEHRNRPITGDVVLIGRQSVYLTESTAPMLFAEEGMSIRDGYFIEHDSGTVGMSGGHLTDRSFFSMLTDARVSALDVSPYEGAEIIADLNKPLPDEYAGIADFIFNGSCLDNLFDPAMAIRNLSRMLRPNGRILDVELGTQAYGAFVMFSPEWFFDFFAANKYDGCRIYIAHFDQDLNDDYDLYLWKPFFEEGGKLNSSPYRLANGDMVVFAIAQKGIESTDNEIPIQAFYRLLQNPAANALHVERAAHYEKSYPVISLPDLPPETINKNELGWQELAYEQMTGMPVRRWMGIGDLPQLKLGNRPRNGKHFEYVGTLRNRWSWK